ncbi:MAG: ppdK, partial [Actinobacteria bacterium]|nr:ppdK [Actinomycetota bacterium]
MKDLLGGKGAGLANMTSMKIPVPAGFTITTEACNTYFENRKKVPPGMWEQVLANLKKIEDAKFGGAKTPLLLSVRSGSKFSMPGMMDTVLNLGLNDTTMKALVEKTGNERFALDTCRRLITMFGATVMGIDRQMFEKALEGLKESKGVRLDTELTTEDLRKLVGIFKGIYEKETGKGFPADPLQQLKLAINAVFNSWFSDRAVTYRKLNQIPHDLGTACNVQAMVFG